MVPLLSNIPTHTITLHKNRKLKNKSIKYKSMTNLSFLETKYPDFDLEQLIVDAC